MSLKHGSYWLKGATIGVVLSITYLAVSGFYISGSYSGELFAMVFYLPFLILSFFLCGFVEPGILKSCNMVQLLIIYFLLFIVMGFVFGALFGWIYWRFKKVIFTSRNLTKQK